MQTTHIPPLNMLPMRNPPPFQLNGVDIDQALAMQYPTEVEREFFFYWMRYGACPPVFPNGFRRIQGLGEKEPSLSEWEDDLDDVSKNLKMMRYDDGVLGEYWQIDVGQSLRSARREQYPAATGRSEICCIQTRWHGFDQSDSKPFVVKNSSPARTHQRRPSYYSPDPVYPLSTAISPSLKLESSQTSHQNAVLQTRSSLSSPLEPVWENSVARYADRRSRDGMRSPTFIPVPERLNRSHRRTVSASISPTPTPRPSSLVTVPDQATNRRRPATAASSSRPGLLSSPISPPGVFQNFPPLQTRGQSNSTASTVALDIAQGDKEQTYCRNASRRTSATRTKSSSLPPRGHQPPSSTTLPSSRPYLEPEDIDKRLNIFQTRCKLRHSPSPPRESILSQPDLEYADTMLSADHRASAIQLGADQAHTKTESFRHLASQSRKWTSDASTQTDFDDVYVFMSSPPASGPRHSRTASTASSSSYYSCKETMIQEPVSAAEGQIQQADIVTVQGHQEVLFGFPVSRREWDEFCRR
ncbi:hypothetical protein SVAN01_04915 [Stagonosporopsis vannaccii]|nr:hypothetical protein SVAN01_04915 [Stagonosporopsis vannaccii]